jgi:hypothetical protein
LWLYPAAGSRFRTAFSIDGSRNILRLGQLGSHRSFLIAWRYLQHDGQGGEAVLWMLAVLSLARFLGPAALEKFPHLENIRHGFEVDWRD